MVPIFPEAIELDPNDQKAAATHTADTALGNFPLDKTRSIGSNQTNFSSRIGPGFLQPGR